MAGLHHAFAAATVLSAAALLAGCATYTAGEGAIEAANRVPGANATIAADPRVTAGLPLTVAIRKVGDLEVGVAYSAVSVPPGRLVLLVDCTLAATRTTTRHELTVDVEPGGRYRLVGEEAPGNRRCGAVRLVPR
ncbi:MAG: hypothetical protein ACK53C_10620 [Pseudomonadota bacterium]